MYAVVLSTKPVTFKQTTKYRALTAFKNYELTNVKVYNCYIKENFHFQK